jgi:hypothetical protein
MMTTQRELTEAEDRSLLLHDEIPQLQEDLLRVRRTFEV